MPGRAMNLVGSAGKNEREREKGESVCVCVWQDSDWDKAGCRNVLIDVALGKSRARQPGCHMRPAQLSSASAQRVCTEAETVPGFFLPSFPQSISQAVSEGATESIVCVCVVGPLPSYIYQLCWHRHGANH